MEERDLSGFLKVTSSVGYGKTGKQIKVAAQRSQLEKRRVLQKERISDGWFRHFLERQPQLTLRKGNCTAFVRMDAMQNNEALSNYFRELKDILDKLEHIYNVACTLTTEPLVL